jgi:hypothetical protein
VLAIIYLGSDNPGTIRRFFSYVTSPAGGFIPGQFDYQLMVYVPCGLAFARTARPLLWGNLPFICAGALIYWLSKRRPIDRSDPPPPRPSDSDKWISAIASFSCRVVDDGQFIQHEYRQAADCQSRVGDFGPNVAIMQSFALGA